MAKIQIFCGTFTIDDGRKLQASFRNQNDKDGFEISLGMYRANLGPVSEDVFVRYMNKFNGTLVSNSGE